MHNICILHVEWGMDGDVTHAYCKHLTRGMENGEWMDVKHVYCKQLARAMENGWRCHTRIL
jgi:hypothetical protein